MTTFLALCMAQGCMHWGLRWASNYVPTRAAGPSLVFPAVIPMENLAKLSNRDFGLYFQNSVSLEAIRALGETALMHALSSRLTLMTPKDVYRTAMGLASCDVLPNLQVLTLLSEKIQAEAKQLRVHEVCALAVEVAACYRRAAIPDESQEIRSTCRSLVSELSGIFESKIFAANPVDLANITMALVDLGIVDVGVLEKVSLAVAVQIALFRGPELVDLLLAFALAGVKSDLLLATALPQLSDRMHTLTHPAQLGHVAFAFAKFGIPDSVPLSEKERFLSKLSSTISAADWTGESAQVRADLQMSITELQKFHLSPRNSN